MTNSDRVIEFVAAWNWLDHDMILAIMAKGIVYHNIPMPVLTGIDEVRGFLSTMNAEKAEWIVHNIAETSDGVVLTERTDRFLMNGSWVEVRVLGVFEFDGPLLSGWRDYFDLAQFTGQLSMAAT